MAQNRKQQHSPSINRLHQSRRSVRAMPRHANIFLVRCARGEKSMVLQVRTTTADALRSAPTQSKLQRPPHTFFTWKGSPRHRVDKSRRNRRLSVTLWNRALVKPILSGREHRAACFVSKLALQSRHRTAFCISPYVLANVARPDASLTLRTYNLQDLTFLWSTARR